jgi:hypothetical protein
MATFDSRAFAREQAEFELRSRDVVQRLLAIASNYEAILELRRCQSAIAEDKAAEVAGHIKRARSLLALVQNAVVIRLTHLGKLERVQERLEQAAEVLGL